MTDATKEESLLEAFDMEMRSQQLLLMATLTNAHNVVDKKTVGLDKKAVKDRLTKIFVTKLKMLLEIHSD